MFQVEKKAKQQSSFRKVSEHSTYPKARKSAGIEIAILEALKKNDSVYIRHLNGKRQRVYF